MPFPETRMNAFTVSFIRQYLVRSVHVHQNYERVQAQHCTCPSKKGLATSLLLEEATRLPVKITVFYVWTIRYGRSLFITFILPLLLLTSPFEQPSLISHDAFSIKPTATPEGQNTHVRCHIESRPQDLQAS